jgi:hypothetical protein
MKQSYEEKLKAAQAASNAGTLINNPILVTWFLVVFGDEVTKILPNSSFTFFTEQDKTSKTEI